MDPWPLSEKVRLTLQIIINYTPVTLPKKIRLDPEGIRDWPERNHCTLYKVRVTQFCDWLIISDTSVVTC